MSARLFASSNKCDKFFVQKTLAKKLNYLYSNFQFFFLLPCYKYKVSTAAHKGLIFVDT